MKTVRFWHYHNGSEVLIKMTAGETLFHSHGGPTDEGWTRESHAWHFDGETVTCEWCHDGADCDGRLTRSGESFCSVADLRAGFHDAETNIQFPRWQERDSRQRDYSAEAMNY